MSLAIGKWRRYLAISPQRSEGIEHIEFIKGTDHTAPVVMAVTIETRESSASGQQQEPSARWLRYRGGTDE